MTTPDDVLNLARADLGYTESPADSNDTKFGAWFGMNGVAWCAEAVSYWFAHAGLPMIHYSYCPVGVANFQNGRWGQWVGRGQAQPGDVVFYGTQGQDHTGIVERDNGDGTVTTIEGNTSSGTSGSQSNGGGVFRRVRAKTGWTYGFGRPNYDLGDDFMADPAVIAAINGANENAAEVRRMFGVMIGALPPASPQEQLLVERLAKLDQLDALPGVNENAAETRRQGGVLLGALPPGTNEHTIAEQVSAGPVAGVAKAVRPKRTAKK